MSLLKLKFEAENKELKQSQTKKSMDDIKTIQQVNFKFFTSVFFKLFSVVRSLKKILYMKFFYIYVSATIEL